MLRVAALAPACALAACAALGEVPPLHETERNLPGRVDVERGAFGLAERRTTPSGDLEAALRPFVVERAAADGSRTVHVLPPFVSHTESDVRKRTRVWPLFSSDSVGSAEERAAGTSDDDTWLLPFVVVGSEPGREDDRMLFPLYGKLHQKLFADELEFAAFPLWARTKADGWESTHVLWPLIAWGEGEGRRHRRFLPFWSESDGASGSKRTALWPFVHWGTETRGARTFDGWFVFPFAGRRTSRDGSFSETTLLWPFFEWSDDATNGDRHRGILWPFHRTSESPSTSTRTEWWWPIHGSHESPAESSEFWAWPILWRAELRDEGRTSRRTFVVPFWMERESGPSGGAADRREIRSWPFFSFRRDAAGVETVRVPEIVPFFGWEAGETAWADLVALWRSTSSPDGASAWDGPLGGIVRWRREASGASRLTILWWLDVPTGSAEASR